MREEHNLKLDKGGTFATCMVVITFLLLLGTAISVINSGELDLTDWMDPSKYSGATNTTAPVAEGGGFTGGDEPVSLFFCFKRFCSSG